jgi:precorrin-2 C20-methyltransferase/precorrin-3B C17-methyltransferase
MTQPGKLYGVGLGTGDPKLMTLRAVECIQAADVVAYHSARHGRSNARRIAEAHLREDHIEEHLVYPLTTETTDHPGGYRGAIEEFYSDAAARLAEHLDAGRSVAILSEGDPLIYSSYQHMHKRLAHRYETETVPGVSSISASVAALGVPLTEDREVLTVLPGTLPTEELAARLASTDSAVILKMGRTFGSIREALETAGRLDDAWYVERATMPEQRVERLAEVDPDSVPYFSMAVLPSKVAGLTVEDYLPTRATAGLTERSARPVGPGRVTVVGTGPAGPLWLTPEAKGALAAADDLVGYTTYVKRVPERAGQVRHLSDNKVESERAEFALSLAREGRNVVVVSSGDPGVFAMATAVLEVACEAQYSAIEVRVLPGMTAAHAAASRVGAPLGHDYATISLSDRLKPAYPRGRRGRPRARHLQPGEQGAAAAGRRPQGPAARGPQARHPGGARAGHRRPDRGDPDPDAGRDGHRRHRHAHADPGRLVADAEGRAGDRRHGRLDAAPLPGLIPPRRHAWRGPLVRQ